MLNKNIKFVIAKMWHVAVIAHLPWLRVVRAAFHWRCGLCHCVLHTKSLSLRAISHQQIAQ